jgi:pimeloyl-ACP methyl ester carboxylesterase
MGPPDPRYADSGGVSIAYQEFGSGALEVVFVMTDGGSHLDMLWEEPGVVRIYERLAQFARVVLFDNRGTGLSDPAGGDRVGNRTVRRDLRTVVGWGRSVSAMARAV